MTQCSPTKNWNWFKKFEKLPLCFRLTLKKQSRITLPNTVQPTWAKKVPDWKEYRFIKKTLTRGGTYHPVTSTPSKIAWALQTPSAELKWLLSQPPFVMATHALPFIASCLSTKSGSTCCTLSFTATTYKGIFWRYSCKLSATHQSLCTYLKSYAGIADNGAQMLWPSIKQHKSMQILQTPMLSMVTLDAALQETMSFMSFS